MNPINRTLPGNPSEYASRFGTQHYQERQYKPELDTSNMYVRNRSSGNNDTSLHCEPLVQTKHSHISTPLPRRFAEECEEESENAVVKKTTWQKIRQNNESLHDAADTLHLSGTICSNVAADQLSLLELKSEMTELGGGKVSAESCTPLRQQLLQIYCAQKLQIFGNKTKSSRNDTNENNRVGRALRRCSLGIDKLKLKTKSEVSPNRQSNSLNTTPKILSERYRMYRRESLDHGEGDTPVRASSSQGFDQTTSNVSRPAYVAVANQSIKERPQSQDENPRSQTMKENQSSKTKSARPVSSGEDFLKDHVYENKYKGLSSGEKARKQELQKEIEKNHSANNKTSLNTQSVDKRNVNSRNTIGSLDGIKSQIEAINQSIRNSPTNNNQCSYKDKKKRQYSKEALICKLTYLAENNKNKNSSLLVKSSRAKSIEVTIDTKYAVPSVADSSSMQSQPLKKNDRSSAAAGSTKRTFAEEDLSKPETLQTPSPSGRSVDDIGRSESPKTFTPKKYITLSKPSSEASAPVDTSQNNFVDMPVNTQVFQSQAFQISKTSDICPHQLNPAAKCNCCKCEHEAQPLHRLSEPGKTIAPNVGNQICPKDCLCKSCVISKCLLGRDGKTVMQNTNGPTENADNWHWKNRMSPDKLNTSTGQTRNSGENDDRDDRVKVTGKQCACCGNAVVTKGNNCDCGPNEMCVPSASSKGPRNQEEVKIDDSGVVLHIKKDTERFTDNKSSSCMCHIGQCKCEFKSTGNLNPAVPNVENADASNMSVELNPWPVWYQQASSNSTDWYDGASLYVRHFHPENVEEAYCPDVDVPKKILEERKNKSKTSSETTKSTASPQNNKKQDSSRNADDIQELSERRKESRSGSQILNDEEPKRKIADSRQQLTAESSKTKNLKLNKSSIKDTGENDAVKYPINTPKMGCGIETTENTDCCKCVTSQQTLVNDVSPPASKQKEECAFKTTGKCDCCKCITKQQKRDRSQILKVSSRTEQTSGNVKADRHSSASKSPRQPASLRSQRDYNCDHREMEAADGKCSRCGRRINESNVNETGDEKEKEEEPTTSRRSKTSDSDGVIWTDNPQERPRSPPKYVTNNDNVVAPANIPDQRARVSKTDARLSNSDARKNSPFIQDDSPSFERQVFEQTCVRKKDFDQNKNNFENVRCCYGNKNSQSIWKGKQVPKDCSSNSKHCATKTLPDQIMDAKRRACTKCRCSPSQLDNKDPKPCVCPKNDIEVFETRTDKKVCRPANDASTSTPASTNTNSYASSNTDFEDDDEDDEPEEAPRPQHYARYDTDAWGNAITDELQRQQQYKEEREGCDEKCKRRVDYNTSSQRTSMGRKSSHDTCSTCSRSNTSIDSRSATQKRCCCKNHQRALQRDCSGHGGSSKPVSYRESSPKKSSIENGRRFSQTSPRTSIVNTSLTSNGKMKRRESRSPTTSEEERNHEARRMRGGEDIWSVVALSDLTCQQEVQDSRILLREDEHYGRFNCRAGFNIDEHALNHERTMKKGVRRVHTGYKAVYVSRTKEPAIKHNDRFTERWSKVTSKRCERTRTIDKSPNRRRRGVEQENVVVQDKRRIR